MTVASMTDVGIARPGLPLGVGDNIPHESIVYFVAAAGRIKIGFSRSFAKRFRNIATVSPEPLTVIGTVHASRSTERILHALSQQHRGNGEWFTDCPEVREIILIALDDPQAIESMRPKGRCLNPLVVWAAQSLRTIAVPKYGERHQQVVPRAADRLGFSYWRTFDLWYRKARRLEISERDAITTALGAQP